jgi:hypothetical protein
MEIRLEEQGEERPIYLEEKFSGLIKTIREERLDFLCKNCKCLLFTNEEISGIYIVDSENYCFILDPLHVTKLLQINKIKTIEYVDNKLKQKDLIFQTCVCLECDKENVVGRFILGTTLEKKDLLQKILVFSEQVEVIIHNIYESYTTNLNSLLKIIEKDEIELKEFCILNKKMEECFNMISEKTEDISEFIVLKENLKGTEEYLDKLIKLAKYVKYLENKNN